MKKLLAMFALLALCVTATFASYNGVDEGSYKGSKCVHFKISVTSTSTDDLDTWAVHTSSFSTLDDIEFVVYGTTTVYVGSYAGFSTDGTDCRVMVPNTQSAVYRLFGRNVWDIFFKTAAGTNQTGTITGTLWGH